MRYDIDDRVLRGEPNKSHLFTLPRRASGWSAYAQAALIVVICTVIAAAMFPLFAPANLIMIYLVGVVIAASRCGRGPSALASFLSVAAFDFFFVHPQLNFEVADTQYILTFAVMLLVGLTISTLTVQQAALASERARLADETAKAQIQIETERTRNTLLSSVSHDLRTPLAVITGATSSLLEREKTLTEADRRELAQVAYEEAERLNRFVGNLLDMTRLESGGIRLEKEWQLLEEVIGSALNRIQGDSAGRSIRVSIPPDFPLVQFDDSLIEQVLVNLLENALKYTPSGTPIDISAIADDAEVTVAVKDRGLGIAPGDEARIFDKFYRAQPQKTKGVGLGLAICRGIIQAHDGRIWAENREGGGAVFYFTLPVIGKPPAIEDEYDTSEHAHPLDRG